MPRIRSVKPEFWTDETLASEVSRDGRLLYIGLWNLADEHGRLRGSARYVKGQLFPYDDDVTVSMVEVLLGQLESARKALRYTVDGDAYLFLPNLARHQRLEAGKVASRLPTPPEKFPISTLNSDDPPPSPGGSDHPQPENVNRSQNQQATAPAASGADKSARGADNLSLLYGTGSMEQGTGNRYVSENAEAQPDPVDAAQPRDTTPARHDVELICRTLADAVEANTGKRPTYGKRWRDAARLMLDRDQIPLADILSAINWAAHHEFWRSVILSAPKLREKYQQMKLQAQRGRSTTYLAPTGTDGPLSTADQRVAAAAALSARLAAEENPQ
jgi:hypothetical protein